LKSKPEILFIADYPNWAFHNIYRSVSLRLRSVFKFSIYFTSIKKRKSNEKLLEKKYEFVWLCYPSDKTYLKLKVRPKYLIKEVASWRWKVNFLSTQEFIDTHLADANFIACPSKELYTELSNYAHNVVYIPNGVETRFFKKDMICKKKSDKLRIGWVGNSKDPLKNFNEVINLQSKGFSVKIAENLSLFQLRNFYQTIDILIITSISESQPLPFLEALSSGCLVVSRPVGIVPEFKSCNNVVIVPFEESFSEYIENLDAILIPKYHENNIVYFNSWDKIINIYNYFFTSVLNENFDFDLFKSRYPNFYVLDSERGISMLKYKASVYLDWLKYGNTKI
jgi:glycosyltransferase involved in cell wall biosynthesis